MPAVMSYPLNSLPLHGLSAALRPGEEEVSRAGLLRASEQLASGACGAGQLSIRRHASVSPILAWVAASQLC
jgi:hypothetical protein